MHARFLLSLPCWLVTLGIALFVTPVQAEEWQPHTVSWQLQKESAQRRIHTAPVAHSSFKAFRAETTIAQPIDAVLAVIAHPASCPLWVDGCLHSQSLGINSFSDRYGYALNDLPWPFRDRELIVHITTQAKAPDTIHISMRAIGDNETLPDDTSPPPARQHATRILHSHAHYVLKAIDQNHTSVVWSQHMEPGGSLPAWLVNMMLTDLPDKSLEALESVAAAPPYLGSTIHYDTRGHISGLSLGNGERINAAPATALQDSAHAITNRTD